MSFRRLTFALVALLLLGSLSPLHAQEETTTVTVAMPSFFVDALRDTINSYNDENSPQIELVATQPPFYNANDGAEAYLDAMTEYVSQADVVYIGSSGQNLPLVTRAGLLLDSSALLSADPDFAREDYFASLIESYQWEGGQWAIPVKGDVYGLVYQPAAFDEAGLAYPTADWTLTDFETAARELATYDDDGNITEAGVVSYTSIADVLITLSDTALYDPMALEIAPTLQQPSLVDTLDQYLTITEDNLIGTPQGGGINLPPLAIAPSTLTGLGSFTGSEVAFAPLPGGATYTNAQGLAISAGASDTQAAYEVISFFLNDAAATQGFIGSPLPVRRDLVGAEPDEDSAAAQFNLSLPEDQQETIVNALETAIPASELLFSAYVNVAIADVRENDTAISAALEEAQLQADEDLQVASEYSSNVTVAVPTQAPQREVAEGQAALNFGYFTFANEIPNRADLDAFVDTYIDETDAVGDIDVERLSFLAGDQSLGDFAERVDCFYYPSNLVRSSDVTLLLALDPLLSSDPNLSADDFIGGTQQQMQVDGQTYGLPVHISPEVLAYDNAAFTTADVAVPAQDWNVADFEQTLRSLDAANGETPPFTPRSFGGSWILSLIAAYGGLPIDYSTDPITLDYTSDATVNAVRQVLDLARNDLIDYSPLGQDASFGGLNFEGDPALYSQLLNSAFNFAGGGSDEDDIGYLTFPQGQDYTPVTLDLGGVFVSASTDAVEPCYGFISALTAQPQLFGGIPARQSQLDNPDMLANATGNTQAFFEAYAQQMQAPNRVTIPSLATAQAGETESVIGTLWLYRAFDAYVTDDADLAAELANAQQLTQTYLECASAIEPFDAATMDQTEYTTRYIQCAVDVDENIRQLFPTIELD